MAKLLVHSCCAHCAAFTFDYWREQGHDITAFWYNPNIHPYSEHVARLKSMRSLAGLTSAPLIEADGYDILSYFRAVVGHENDRCRHCFALRLGQAAEQAARGGFEAFTTTLLISPQQKHEIIRETGERTGREKAVRFLYADLRKRYSESRRMTKPLELYRQQYCGCIYSEWERYKGQA